LEASEVNHPDGRESARSDAAYNLSLVLCLPCGEDEAMPGVRTARAHRFGLVSNHKSVSHSVHPDMMLYEEHDPGIGEKTA